MSLSPSVENYVLGRGVLSAAEWSGGAIGSYVDMGNAPTFEVELTLETLEHFSSRSGLKTKDKEVVLQAGYNLNFTLDEKSATNLRLFLLGTQSGQDIRGLTALDTEYALKFTSDNPEGPNEVWNFWKAKFKPAGAHGLISDEWATMQFTASGLSDATGHATSPYFTVTRVTSTSTTTTTTTT